MCIKPLVHLYSCVLGLQCYEQAGEAYEKALELDSEYHDATEELKKLKVEQLTVSVVMFMVVRVAFVLG